MQLPCYSKYRKTLTMNRFKKEEIRNRRELRAGLSEMEIKLLDREEFRQHMIFELARSIHEQWFPEEYDHIYDSIEEAKDRLKGINPMSESYNVDIATRRKAISVSPLSESGMPICNDSWQIAYTEAEARMKSRIK